MSENNGSRKTESNDRPSDFKAGKSTKKISTTKADKKATATSTNETEIEEPVQKLSLTVTESEQINSQNERKLQIQGSAGETTRRLSQDAVLPERLLVVSKIVFVADIACACVCLSVCVYVCV